MGAINAISDNNRLHVANIPILKINVIDFRNIDLKACSVGKWVYVEILRFFADRVDRYQINAYNVRDKQ